MWISIHIYICITELPYICVYKIDTPILRSYVRVRTFTHRSRILSQRSHLSHPSYSRISSASRLIKAQNAFCEGRDMYDIRCLPIFRAVSLLISNEPEKMRFGLRSQKSSDLLARVLCHVLFARTLRS